MTQSQVKFLGRKPIPKYELLGTNDRITMAIRGTTSVHTQVHNVPLELPPPPGVHNLNILIVILQEKMIY